MAGRALTAILLGGVLAVSPACSRTRQPNVILVSIDTLRADHLGCYGYSLRTSPQLDQLAAQSTVYTNVVAPTPWTLPSHAALLTGIHPYRLGLLDEHSRMPQNTLTLAESLARAGYQTAAFVDSDPSGFVGAKRGFDRGFAIYRHAPHDAERRYKYDAKATVRVAESWLAQRDTRRPFFLFLHTKSVHATPQGADRRSDAPYDKPPRYLKRFLPGGRPRFSWRRDDRVRGVLYLRDLNTRIAAGQLTAKAISDEQIRELIALYDAGIYYADEQIGRLIEILDRLGLGRNTVLIITADHGEAFFEHRFLLHQEVYQPLLRVPLIVHDPRHRTGRRVTTGVFLEDVAPTILRLAGLGPSGGIDGRALPDNEQSTAPSRNAFAYYRFGLGQRDTAYSLADGRYKLVRQTVGGQWLSELYDLQRDPAERSPLHGEGDRDREHEMLARLESLVRAVGRSGESLSLDKATVEELRALGYVQ